jgi:hypothetical protein|tara:strand:- start:1230 stop:1664 length:435 start_codon:yes stop_codon:yes gene_type:complete
MFSNFFFKKKYNKLSFEDIQFAVQNPDQIILINTLYINEQDCLIKNTISHNEEETIINTLITNYELTTKKIIVYGKNNIDETCFQKYDQLVNLGFSNVYVYVGGMFEWLLLQDIYGNNSFPTTKNMLDILKYKPFRTFGSNLLL